MKKVNMISDDEKLRAGVRDIYTTVRILDRVELWSGGEKDPMIEAKMDAEERLAVDVGTGKILPYDVTVSFPALRYDRKGNMLETMGELERKCLMGCQLVNVHVVVFENELAHRAYMEAEHVIVPRREVRE